MNNQYVLNPAAGGIGYDIYTKLCYRNQWLNFDGAPESYYFSFNMPLSHKIKTENSHSKINHSFHSVGSFVFKDATGPFSKSTFLLSYGYNIPIYKKLRLALGAFGGVTSVNLDQSELKFDQPGEVVQFQSTLVPDGSVGLWLHDDRFFLGISNNQLFKNKIDFLLGGDKNSNPRLTHHYYSSVGYRFPLGTEILGQNNIKWYLIPSAMLKYGAKRTPASLDLNLKLTYNNLFWLGTSYRVKDAFVAIVGTNIRIHEKHSIEVSYSFDQAHTQINRYSIGSHEILVGYVYKLQPHLQCPSKFW